MPKKDIVLNHVQKKMGSKNETKTLYLIKTGIGNLGQRANGVDGGIVSAEHLVVGAQLEFGAEEEEEED